MKRLHSVFAVAMVAVLISGLDSIADEFVYVYSHDNDSAYKPADRMVMARVPADHVTNPDAYEYFTGLNEAGQPTWSADSTKLSAVFSHPGRCYRSGISYNAPLKRYLWCQILPGPDTRFEGGLTACSIWNVNGINCVSTTTARLSPGEIQKCDERKFTS